MILWRISVNSLLAVIAAACVTMAAFRFHPAVGAFSFGAFLMGGARFHQLRRLDESYALGLRTMKDLNRLGVSIAAAGLILTVAALPAVILFVSLRLFINGRYYHRTEQFEGTDPFLIVVSSFAGLAPCMFLEWLFGWTRRTAIEKKRQSGAKPPAKRNGNDDTSLPAYSSRKQS